MDRRRFIRNGLAAAALLPLSLPQQALRAASLPTDPTAFTALELSAAIRNRRLSCVEVMRAYLQRIHRYNPVYNAIVSMPDDDLLVTQARDADRELARGAYRGWMHGMPHAVKDLTAVAGLRFTNGSPLFADRIADQDSETAARIRAAGAIFIGKTNAPEFGLGSQTYNPVFGPTASAWNPALTSGGSSGGAASGLGVQMLPVADGSDMMGSLRNPGAYNNVIGFRPGTSTMSRPDVNTRSMSVGGPMGRNTADTIQLLQTLAIQPLAGSFDALNLKGLRIGWMGNLNGYLAMESGILDLCESSLRTLQDAGARVAPVLPPVDPQEMWRSWTNLRHAGRAGLRRYYDDPQSRPLLKPELVWEIEQGMALSREDIERANQFRNEWYRVLDRLFDEYDFLAMPTAQVFAYSKIVHWPEFIGERKMDTYHRWMEVVVPGSLGGIPVLNVPVGFDRNDRPMGMQILGRFGMDKKVLEFGLAYEQITDFLQRQPTLVAANQA